MRKFIFFSAIVLLLVFVSSCMKSDKIEYDFESVPKEILGTWYFQGFGNDYDETFIKIDTTNKETHELNFSVHRRYSGKGFGTPLMGNFKVKKDSIIFKCPFGDARPFPANNLHGKLFAAFDKMKFRFYVVKQKDLFIYYTQSEYLLYKRKID